MERRGDRATKARAQVSGRLGLVRRVSGPDGLNEHLEDGRAIANGTRTSDGEDLVVSLLSQHASAVLGVARRYSLCADDAHDAYQRAMEILLRRAASLEPETAPAWLKTVVKHEAMAVRAERIRTMPREEISSDLPSPGSDPADRSAGFQRLAAAAEALEQLKPHEAKAIILKAQGLSYSEIGASQGWSYTKVNRLLSEGRSAMRERLESIESGRECERIEPMLGRHIDGELGLRERRAVSAHLRRCPGCRKALVQQRRSTEGIAALAPVGIVVAGCSTVRPWDVVIGWFSDRTLAGAARLQSAAEIASTGKVAAVAATAAVAVGGGVAAQHAVSAPQSASSAPAAFRVKAASSSDAIGSTGTQSDGGSTGDALTSRRRRKIASPSKPLRAQSDAEFATGSSGEAVGLGKAASSNEPQAVSSSVDVSLSQDPPADSQGAAPSGEFGP